MRLADAQFTVNGIPLHPLLVHAVVVLLPLSAVGAVVIALIPRWRRRYWLPVLVLAALGIAAVPITQKAGEDLQTRLGPLKNPELDRHTQLGGDLLPYALAFGVMLIVLLVAGRLADRERDAVVQSGQYGLRQQPVAAGVHSLDELEEGHEGGLRGDERPEEPLEATPPMVSRFWRVITVLVSVAVIASAVAVTYEVYLVGDSGASAVWKGVGGS